MILAARGVLVDEWTWIPDGGLVIERGRVASVLRSRGAVLRRASRTSLVDLGDVVLSPGLVNAHAHLDLGALAGELHPDAPFVTWIGDVVRARARLTGAAVERGVRAGARSLMESGTTAVGDIDASGTTERIASSLGLRLVVFRELLDAWAPERTRDALAKASARSPRSARVHGGLSPHAPYTTSFALLRGASAVARRRRLPLAIHWSESREERAWLEGGRGPLAKVLPRSPGRTGLELLAEARLLGRRTALVHGNLVRPDELELLARRRVTLVHCPGTHAFFARPRFPLERYRSAGVMLALGTDSLASNTALDLRREMALLRQSHAALDPAFVFDMATAGGARALACPDLGHLRPGARADLVAWRLEARTREEALDHLTAASPAVEHVFVAGAREKTGPSAAPPRAPGRTGRESSVH